MIPDFFKISVWPASPFLFAFLGSKLKTVKNDFGDSSPDFGSFSKKSQKGPSEGPLFWPDSPGIICLLWQRDSSSPVSPQSRCDEARQPPEAGQPPHLAANKSKLSSVMQRYQSGPHVVRLGVVVVGDPAHLTTTSDCRHKHHQQTCYGR